jgi:hypothetical protein
MAIDFGTGPHSSSRTAIVLSAKTKTMIREIAGGCEYCDALHPPDALEVFQIGMLSGSPTRPNENPAHAVIVLCKEHYRQAFEGIIPKSDLKNKVANRPDKKKKALRTLFQTRTGAGVKEYRNPAVFSVGDPGKEKSGRR